MKGRYCTPIQWTGVCIHLANQIFKDINVAKGAGPFKNTKITTMMTKEWYQFIDSNKKTQNANNNWTGRSILCNIDK